MVYDNFRQPWQPSAVAPPRQMQTVALHAEVDPSTGAIGPWTDLERGAIGDARASSANGLSSEFLGDYNYAVATRDYGATVSNDVREASDCAAMDTYRQALVDGAANAASLRPAPQVDCLPTFGNTDIFGGSYSDPTP